MPVVEHFSQQGRVIKVPADGTVDDVYEKLVKSLAEKGISPS
jgi:adenylate kinase family enzyme